MISRDLSALLEKAEKKGVEQGIKIMEQRMLLACKNGNPINIEGKAYFIKSDMQNLHNLFEKLEADAEDIQTSKNYIVPMRKVVDGKCEEVKVIISAQTSYEAWCGAIYNFKDDGWLVFSEYDKYEQL